MLVAQDYAYVFASKIMPMITLTLFSIGVIYRLYLWLKYGGHRALYRVRMLGTIKEFILNSIFLTRILRSSKTLWVIAATMHISIFLILFGHLRPFGIWSKELISWLGSTVEEFFVNTLPTWLGVVFTITAGILLVRRIVIGVTRHTSRLEDYGVLVLLLLIGITGSIMRLSEHLHQELFVEFLPGITFKLEHQPSTYWFTLHLILVQLFILYLPFGKMFHIALTPISILVNSNLEKVKHTLKTPGLSKKQVLDIYGCTACGICTDVCQVYKATNGDYKSYYDISRSLKSYMRWEFLSKIIPPLKSRAENALSKLSKDAYYCLLCGRCSKFCPALLDTVTLGVSTREVLTGEKVYPENMKMVREMTLSTKNVLGMPNEERGMWAEYSIAPPPTLKEGSEMAYFVGCMASFSPAVQDVPLAVAEVLTAAGIDFTILGGEEWCCGYPLVIGGLKKEAEELIKHNLETLKKLKVKTVVFSCPSCFLTWSTEYPIEDIQLIHHTQLINKFIKEGRLKLKELKAKITYHDPCDLGRKSHVYEEPREVIKSIPGVEFVEMQWNREKSLCCGGGGDVEIVDENLPVEIGKQVIEEAERVGAEILVTACQQCKRTLLKAAKAAKSNVKVMDIAELVLRVLEQP